MDQQASIFQQPAGDDTPLDGLSLMRQLATNAQSKLRMGGSLSREEHKAIATLAILDRADTHWPDRPAIADELGVTAKVVEKYKAEGCPIEAHNPTEKLPVYRWLLAVYKQKGGGKAADSDPARQEKIEQARYRRLKNDEIEGVMIAEAEASALETITRVMRTMKENFLYSLPTKLSVALADLPRNEQERVIRDTIRDELTAMAENAGALEDMEEGKNE